MLNVAVTGSHGLIGSSLVEMFRSEGHVVNRLVRRSTADPLQNEFEWHPEREEIDTLGLNPIDIVIHCAGEGTVGRWTTDKMRRIRESRVDGTRFLAETLAALPQPPSVLLSASTVSIYGDTGTAFVSENTPPGEGFLADVSRESELATQPAREAGIRVVNLRFGIVLSRVGGAFPLVDRVFRWGLGGHLGDGNQYMSWVTLEDALRIVRWTIRKQMEGPVNVVSPSPITHRRLAASLSTTLNRPSILRVPAPVARAVLGGITDGMLLKSTRAIPERLETSGFRFRASTIQSAWEVLS